MKTFKTRVFAVLLSMCMMLSLLPIPALAAEDEYSLTIDVDGTGVTWYAADKAGTEIGDEGFAVPTTDIEVDTDGEAPAISLTTTVYVKANRGYAITELEELDLDIDGEDEDADQSAAFDMEITDEGLEYCDLKVTLKFDGYAVEGKSTTIALRIDAEPTYELFLDVDGTGVTWYAADEEGAEISDEGFAVPTTDIEIDTDGEVPTISLTTTVYVKANRGYAITELEEMDLDIDGEDEDEDLPSTFDMEITDEGLEYCDLKVTLKFDGYAVQGKYADIALRIDAEPTYELFIDVDGTGVIWCAEDKEGTEIGDDFFAIPATEIEVDTDGEVPTISVTSTVYVKAAPGYAITELEELEINGEGDDDKDDSLHSALDIEITDEGLEYCDLKVTLKFDGYAVQGKYADIALRIDAEPAGLFTDVSPSGYYYDAVAWAVEQGVTKGTGDGTTFSPNDNCTRAQFVTFLWRAAGSPEPASTKNPFTDVSETGHTDYYKAILWATEEGIIFGTGDGTTFSPNMTVTRAQSIISMYRYAQKAGIATETGIEDFDDVVGEDTQVRDAIGWAVANGITSGNGTTTNIFGPMDDCTRGMTITFLCRLFTESTA